MVSGYGSKRRSHDLETRWFPRAVPFKKGAGVCVPEHGASMCGARVRGREDEEERVTAMETVEREGCPIKERSLPGVGAHDAGASSTGPAGAAWRGIEARVGSEVAHGRKAEMSWIS